MKFYPKSCYFLAATSLVLSLGPAVSPTLAAAPMASHPEYLQKKDYQGYLKFFEEVYRTMSENYYHPLSPENLNKFLYVFNTRLYPEFKATGATSNFIKWRSAAYLVEALRAPDDIFSAFYPPKAATNYEMTALGKKVDLGITGKLVATGYEVTRLEPRADAFEKGLREHDIIQKIERQNVLSLTESKIADLLTPLENAKVTLEYTEHVRNKKQTVIVTSKEYFKQLVFRVPTGVPGIYCLELEHFNQMTGPDMGDFLKDILADKDLKGLILDLRGNPGGPPLAADEISGFFLSPEEPFAYFQRNNRPPAILRVPASPPGLHYDGELVILVDKKSGSASELFSGVLQHSGRAVLMGTNSAGQVFLKSMFPFADGSMMLLVTARGHYPDGGVFSYDGLVPDDQVLDPKTDLVKYAAQYLLKKTKQPIKSSAGKVKP